MGPLRFAGYSQVNRPSAPSRATFAYDMTVLKPRSRMISVRLSEEEYAALRGLCAITGARSVSDITRDAMRVFLSGSGRETVLGGHLQEWQAHLCSLDARIEQLALEIRTLKSNLSN